MIIAGVLVDESASSALKKLGVKDSKMLFHATRKKLAMEIELISKDIDIITLSPAEIDHVVINSFNLNKLEAVTMAKIVNNLTEKTKDKVKIYIDCPSVNIEVWKGYLLEHITNKENKEFIVEHKADVNYPAVSAASIMAKVRREYEVEKLKKELDIDFGSGYPSDPLTVSWLKENHEEYRKYGIIRESWSTFKNLKKENRQKKLF